MIRGDFVFITYQGKTLEGMVMLASENERSLIIGFDGMLGGYMGTMPVYQEEGGAYVDVFNQLPVVITPNPCPSRN